MERDWQFGSDPGFKTSHIISVLWLVIDPMFIRPLKAGDFCGVPYNRWQKWLLNCLLVITALQTLGSVSDKLRLPLLYISTALYLLPTVVILLAWLWTRYGAERGRRLRWALRRRFTRRYRFRRRLSASGRLNDTALREMEDGLREPMIVHQIREEQEN